MSCQLYLPSNTKRRTNARRVSDYPAYRASGKKTGPLRSKRLSSTLDRPSMSVCVCACERPLAVGVVVADEAEEACRHLSLSLVA